MCTLEKHLRYDKKIMDLIKANIVEAIELGHPFFKPKFFASDGDSDMEFVNLDEGIEYLLQDGWEPFSISFNDDDFIYYFRRKVE